MTIFTAMKEVFEKAGIQYFGEPIREFRILRGKDEEPFESDLDGDDSGCRAGDSGSESEGIND